ncbi:hypothetical protein Tco_0918000 [Tanacetum coccineum]
MPGPESVKNQESEKSPKEIIKAKKEQDEEKQDSTYSIRSTDKVDLEEFDLKSALFSHMNKKKSANKNTTNYRLYHALMEALIADEDAMDKEVADKVKDHKRKHDSDDDEDDDDDEGPSAGSNQGRSTKRRRSDSAASGSAKPPPKADDQSSMKPRESDASASKQHPALTSTGWQITDTRDAGADSSMHRSDPESEHSEHSSDDISKQDEGNDSAMEDTDNAHIPKVSTTTWFKPIPESERPATPEPEWTIPSNDFPEPEHNWANAYASTFKVPEENKLQRKTYDIGSFIKWFCRRTGKKKLCKADLEGPAFNLVKAFHKNSVFLQYQMDECHKLLTNKVDLSNPEGHQILRNIYEPLPLGGPPGQVTIQPQFFFNKDLDYLLTGDKERKIALSISKLKAARYLDFGLEELVPSLWVESEREYDISAVYGITHWWFRRKEFYINKHSESSDREAVRSQMRILSVISVKVFEKYGYNYLREIILRRADYQEYKISEKDFKNLPATPEPEWTIPPNDFPEPEHNWANAYASTFKVPEENKLQRKTYDIGSFIKWFCRRTGKKKLCKADLEGPAFNLVKAFHKNSVFLQYQMDECHKLLTNKVDLSNPEGHQILRNIYEPLPLGGPPGQVTIQPQFFFNKDLDYLLTGDKERKIALSISKLKAARYLDFGLEELVPSLWVESEREYDISAVYGITHWWFRRKEFYINKHSESSDREAVRSQMRILSVISVKVFEKYGYNYLREIILRRADYQEYKISEKDFKNLHPNDFEDLFLLNIQEKLNHLPKTDKISLHTAVNMWIRNLVIRNRVGDLQLGIESYQTKINLERPNWDAADYYFKEDYTIVPKPRAVVYRDRNNQRKLMRLNELHKFSDGTLTRVMEKLDQMVKDFHLFEYNKGMESRKWSEDDKRRSKDFITAIEKRLQIRRIYRSLESFVGGRRRDIDYRLINRTT